jgi:hypothetical protein
LDPVASWHGERSPNQGELSSEKTELVKDVFGTAGFVSKDAVSSSAKFQCGLLRSRFATPPEEASGSSMLSFLGEVSPVLTLLARSSDFFDALIVLDLKPRVAEVIQALDLGEARGLKSPEIGPNLSKSVGGSPSPISRRS